MEKNLLKVEALEEGVAYFKKQAADEKAMNPESSKIKSYELNEKKLAECITKGLEFTQQLYTQEMSIMKKMTAEAGAIRSKYLKFLSKALSKET